MYRPHPPPTPQEFLSILLDLQTKIINKLNKAKYDDVLTQLYWGVCVVVVFVNVVVVVVAVDVVVFVVNVVIVALLVVTDNIIFSCGQ